MQDVISVYQGDYKRLRVEVSEAGEAYDITGASVYVTVKRREAMADGDAGVVQNKTTVHDDAANGLTHVELMSGDTAGLAEGEYLMDVRLIEATSKPRVLWRGRLRVDRPVTMATTL